jgi:hypothetical protein
MTEDDGTKRSEYDAKDSAENIFGSMAPEDGLMLNGSTKKLVQVENVDLEGLEAKDFRTLSEEKVRDEVAPDSRDEEIAGLDTEDKQVGKLITEEHNDEVPKDKDDIVEEHKVEERIEETLVVEEQIAEEHKEDMVHVVIVENKVEEKVVTEDKVEVKVTHEVIIEKTSTTHIEEKKEINIPNTDYNDLKAQDSDKITTDINNDQRTITEGSQQTVEQVIQIKEGSVTKEPVSPERLRRGESIRFSRQGSLNSEMRKSIPKQVRVVDTVEVIGEEGIILKQMQTLELKKCPFEPLSEKKEEKENQPSGSSFFDSINLVDTLKVVGITATTLAVGYLLFRKFK